ncbi:MAG TPA: hypothetical protein VNU93_10660, partial [Verrucomicrobiae bacterium]|nr:hypothetical protein [Verrucomicrobiae bacterium]
EGYIADFPGQQQPGVLKSMLHTNALVDIAPQATLGAKQKCNLILLDEWEEKDDTGNFCGGKV